MATAYASCVGPAAQLVYALKFLNEKRGVLARRAGRRRRATSLAVISPEQHTKEGKPTMARHKNPQYNRKRLVVAGIAAVTTLGVAVGIGIYGNAFADQSAPAASQQCLPAQPAASTTAAPTTSTTATQPTQTTPPQTAPTGTAGSGTNTGTQTQPTDTATEQPTNTGTSIPDTTETTETTSTSKKGWLAGDKMLSLSGPKGSGSQPTTPNDYGGPKPADQAPAAQPGTEQTFAGGQNCQNQFGPFAKDFISIFRVRPNNLAASPQPRRGASTGTFNVSCGTNKNGHNNSANMIAAPGNVNGAQHTHDYVGNLTTDGFSSNESLTAGGTTCTNGDKSAYFWPVIRIRNKGSKAVDPLNAHNFGDPILPASAKIEFRGNARGPVVAAPEFLRILTGDAKSSTNGGANQNAKWTCSGFENRITTKYPLCPRGSQTVRIADFPGCWDGQNTDSANHRTHIAFADKSGNCPQGFKAIPQLRITLKYNLPQGKVFALDAFPAELHNPITDHNDFVNVMGAQLMNKVVQCINTGRRC